MNATLTLTLLTEEQADPAAAEMLRAAKKNLGFVPNMYASMANAPGLLSTYLHGYDAFRKQSGFTAAEQEVVFLTISRANACHYCVAAHSMLAEKMSQVPAQAISAIRSGVAIEDARLAALSSFTARMVETRGNPAADEVKAFLAAGYSQAQVLQVLLAIAVKAISNYSNHLFATPVDAAFAAYEWHPA